MILIAVITEGKEVASYFGETVPRRDEAIILSNEYTYIVTSVTHVVVDGKLVMVRLSVK